MWGTIHGKARMESHPSTQTSETRGSWVLGQPKLYSKTLSQKTENENINGKGDIIARRLTVQDPNLVHERMLPLTTLWSVMSTGLNPDRTRWFNPACIQMNGIAEDDFEFMVLLSLPFVCWDYMPVPPHSVGMVLGIEPWVAKRFFFFLVILIMAISIED